MPKPVDEEPTDDILAILDEAFGKLPQAEQDEAIAEHLLERWLREVALDRLLAVCLESPRFRERIREVAVRCARQALTEKRPSDSRGSE